MARSAVDFVTEEGFEILRSTFELRKLLLKYYCWYC